MVALPGFGVNDLLNQLSKLYPQTPAYPDHGLPAEDVLSLPHRTHFGGKTTLEQAKPDVEKFCYVISGRVRCSIGQEIHELKTGDSLYFNSGQAHQMENAGANSAKVLCVAVLLAL